MISMFSQVISDYFVCPPQHFKRIDDALKIKLSAELLLFYHHWIDYFSVPKSLRSN